MFFYLLKPLLKLMSSLYPNQVEGGRIDHANHDNFAKIALEETVALDTAIETAMDKVKLKETLIVVTADHSHSLSMNGYPKRGNPIEGMRVYRAYNYHHYFDP